MPNHRTPPAKAQVEGRHLQHPGRHKGRKVPRLEPLGAPPNWVRTEVAAAWDSLSHDLPWLNRSHRALVEIAATVLARLRSGDEVGVNALNLLRLCLGQMGATPVDAGKVPMPEEEEQDDLLD
eukprot:jgi/Tetstr1/450992/TSEL_038028.t1